MSPVQCPCGSDKLLSDCCEPYISGRATPPTAEALMRARYSSYATGRIDFIEKTHAAAGGADFDRKASEKWAKESSWKGLTILAVKDGAETDDQGVVSFVARFSAGGKDYEHREIATFRKENGEWRFLDGQSPKPETFVKSGPELGRNDPCSCGSGRKFKKCHGI